DRRLAQTIVDIVLHDETAGIGDQLLAKRDDPSLDPRDDAGNELDDLDTSDAARIERRLPGVAEAETTDHHVELVASVHRDRARCELAFRDGDRAAHQQP